ncbi:branched chain amino acid aminotransferase apoenzyme [Tessaracoccus bendigoensis DSM 12906]|uniref:Branched-chain-amino-acid aminotransferase n=1 Tax=Tessaracoccus bendigoensis DSM 12906 TaxID=1123357 RepID=A0A1M6FEC7_9ACTN|nr:branched-chain amino acid aminotransferase [Tessaracoccus bendigoensis]SHI96084.1 branched chain amino acid aminotransferase apoenzyme [Tessaracoccus bendigoensis DSM 12906]
MTQFTVHPAQITTPEMRASALTDPGFGATFSDHMALVDWTAELGWHGHRIVGYGPFELDPASAVLHYAQEAFEGLKAYAHSDGSIWRFRAEVNADRFQRSCRRLGLPELPVEDFLASIDQLVTLERDWVPTGQEQSLYLRPFMFARSPILAVKPSTQVTYAVIASPSGAYFGGTGVQPVDIWFTRDYTRAAPGGTGFAKCGGNYAASMVAQLEAEAAGCSQVGFLDAVEHRFVEELGGMNLFVVTADDRVITPALTDTILEGVTRSAILKLAAASGLTIEERRITLDELFDGIDTGRFTEVFACGTAAIITPVGMLKDADGGHVVGDGSPGGTTLRLRQQLTDIQYGRVEDVHGWTTRIV